MQFDTGISAATTAAQNQVTAVNDVVKALRYISGQYTSIAYTGSITQLIYSGEGRLVSLCVVNSGGGKVKFYDSASTIPSALPDTALLFVLDSNAALGITQIGVQFTDGIVMVAESGVSLNVTYSAG